MAGAPPSKHSDISPTREQVGNGHWPAVSNYFQGHGQKFVDPHEHPGLTDKELKEVHKPTNHGGMNLDHDKSAVYK